MFNDIKAYNRVCKYYYFSVHFIVVQLLYYYQFESIIFQTFSGIQPILIEKEMERAVSYFEALEKLN